mgnify:CR=1 FL=1
MINLLGDEAKNEIRSARLNVQLRKFALLSFFVAVGIFAIYGVGFYFVMGEKDIAEHQLNQDNASVAKYRAVRAKVKDYKTNLAIANKVLTSSMSYSTFLTSTARTLPAGSILTNLTLTNIGGTSGGKTSEISLHARTTSYGGALQIKESLELSDIFEKVSLADTNQVEASAESTATEKKYPFTVNVSVTISKQGVSN